MTCGAVRSSVGEDSVLLLIVIIVVEVPVRSRKFENSNCLKIKFLQWKDSVLDTSLNFGVAGVGSENLRI